MPITADKRGYVAGKYGIELDGIMAGWIWSAEGGHATLPEGGIAVFQLGQPVADRFPLVDGFFIAVLCRLRTTRSCRTVDERHDQRADDDSQ